MYCFNATANRMYNEWWDVTPPPKSGTPKPKAGPMPVVRGCPQSVASASSDAWVVGVVSPGGANPLSLAPAALAAAMVWGGADPAEGQRKNV